MAGVYLHIPFCESKCIYCDFYSLAGKKQHFNNYIKCLLTEASLRKNEIVEPIKTIYVGGGTPSRLSIEQFRLMIDGLCRNLSINMNDVDEFTVEVNPDDVTTDYMLSLKQLGVNRISVGVQSFDDHELKFINRRHNAAQAIQAIACMQQAGFDNISLDLIFGIPGQTLDTWRRNIMQAVDLEVCHISAYCLMYEKGTRLWAMRQTGKVHEIDEELSIKMYQTLIDELKKADFEHYEISNFAKNGYISHHNSSYWDLTPYLGLGVAAHSYDGHFRRYNPSNLKEYIGKLSLQEIAFEQEHEEEWEKYDEYVMLRLRTAHGLVGSLLKEKFNIKFYDYFMSKAPKFLQQKDTRFFIPEEHVMLTDSITGELLWEEE